MVIHGAVAVIETPTSFILEGRPNWPGKLAFAGKTGLFGGHIEKGETARVAIRRELHQELGLNLTEVPLLLWEGEVAGENKTGNPARVKVSLFYLFIDSVKGLSMKVPGEMVEVPKTLVGIRAYQEKMTPFTFRTLRSMVVDEPSMTTALALQ